MKNISYKEYSKCQMLKAIKKDGFIFVETSLNDNYIIKKNDLADFIILEAQRTGHIAELSCFMPGIDEPVITTYGWFLNKANPILREEIISRLVLLQTTKTKPKNVKVFNLRIFYQLTSKEMGIEDSKINNFDKLYKKYQYSQEEYNRKLNNVA